MSWRREKKFEWCLWCKIRRMHKHANCKRNEVNDLPWKGPGDDSKCGSSIVRQYLDHVQIVKQPLTNDRSDVGCS